MSVPAGNGASTAHTEASTDVPVTELAVGDEAKTSDAPEDAASTADESAKADSAESEERPTGDSGSDQQSADVAVEAQDDAPKDAETAAGNGTHEDNHQPIMKTSC